MAIFSVEREGRKTVKVEADRWRETGSFVIFYAKPCDAHLVPDMEVMAFPVRGLLQIERISPKEK